MATFDGADQMVTQMVSDVLAYGDRSEARGRASLDVQGWTGVLDNPRARVVTNPVRGMRTGYPAASVAWNLARRNDAKTIAWWNPRGMEMSDDGLRFHGANYGERMWRYLVEAMFLIKSDQGTRRAWVPIWTPSDLVAAGPENYSREGKDVPCTLGFGLRMRYDLEAGPVLDLNVVMRSQSAWAVFPYDLYLFTVIQELCANELNLGLGRTGWHCVSLHVYDSELQWASDGVRAWNAGEVPAEDMEAIGLTLSDAACVYPEAMDRFMREAGATTQGLPSDPVISQMFSGAWEIHEGLAAKAARR